MKKTFSIISIITVVFITLFSCSKKQNDFVDKVKTNNLTEYETTILNKLTNFKHKLNSNLRDNDPMTLDSAEWYMESYYNVVEARTEDPYKNVRKDTTYYTLPLNSQGMVEFADMNSMYNQMLSDLDSLEYLIANPNIFPVYGMLDLLSSNGSSADFMLTTGFGSSYNGNYEPFDADDDWHWGNMQGRCDGTYLWVSDGGQELKRRLNNPYFQWAGPGSFIDPVSRNAYYYEYPDVNNENPESNVGYLIYYEESTINNPLPCLENDEMTFYLNKAHDIIYTFDNQNLPGTTTLYGKRPAGKAFMSFDIYTPDGTVNNNYYWEHEYFIKYGTRINLPLPD